MKTTDCPQCAGLRAYAITITRYGKTTRRWRDCPDCLGTGVVCNLCGEPNCSDCPGRYDQTKKDEHK